MVKGFEVEVKVHVTNKKASITCIGNISFGNTSSGRGMVL